MFDIDINSPNVYTTRADYERLFTNPDNMVNSNFLGRKLTNLSNSTETLPINPTINIVSPTDSYTSATTNSSLSSTLIRQTLEQPVTPIRSYAANLHSTNTTEGVMKLFSEVGQNNVRDLLIMPRR
jgi:hypothetical protein